MPRASNLQQQTRPEVVADPEGGVTTVNDMRLPQFAYKYVAKDIVRENWNEVVPVEPTSNPIVIAGGSATEKVVFNFNSPPNILVDWDNSYISFKLKLKRTTDGTNFGYVGGTVVDAPGVAAEIAASSEYHSTGAAPANGDTLGFIYTRSMQNLFKKIIIKDFTSNLELENIDQFSMLKTLELAGQGPDFWDQGTERDLAHEMGASVHKFMSSRSEGLAAVDRTFPMTAAGSNTVIPYFANLPTTAGTLGAGVHWVMEDVRAFLNQIANGFTFKIPPPSYLLRSGNLMSVHYSPISLEMYLNSYARAFTDYFAALTGTTWPTAPTSKCKGFEIEELRFHVHQYQLNDVAANKLQAIYTGPGWSRWFSGVKQFFTHVDAGTTRHAFSFGDRNVHSVEHIAMIIRREADVTESALKPKTEFTNGSNLSDVALTAAGPSTYSGVNSVQFSYLMDRFPLQPMRMGPNDFGNIKQLTARLFDEDCLQTSQYEGLSPTLNWENGRETGFFIGYDFCTNDYQINSGLDISVGPLNIEMTFAGTGHPALAIDTYIFYSTECHVGADAISTKF